MLAAFETGLEIKWFLKVNLGILYGTRRYRHEGGGGKKVGLDPHQVTLELFPRHDPSLGLRAEMQDSGLSADFRSLVAHPRGGPADA